MIAPSDTDLYWASREFKTWVVSLKARKVRLTRGTDENGRATYVPLSTKRDMYVRSRTSQGATRCALANLYCGESMQVVDVRLASPHDLGCTAGSAS